MFKNQLSQSKFKSFFVDKIVNLDMYLFRFFLLIQIIFKMKFLSFRLHEDLQKLLSNKFGFCQNKFYKFEVNKFLMFYQHQISQNRIPGYFIYFC